MASVVGICNRGLQLLGSKRITSLTEDTKQARACNFVYEEIRDEELRKHPWSCATARASLAKAATDPLHTKTNRFLLPSDFIRLLEADPEVNYNDRDWQIENGYIYTNWSAPLKIRYIFRLTDPNIMDPLFRKTLSYALAEALCEELTQSNTKLQIIRQGYDSAIKDARKANAFERVALEPPTDTWISIRE